MTGVQLLRLIVSGVFDRHPDLQVIVGHWGRNVRVTGSGHLSERYLRRTAEVVGADRMLYATDYPYTYATNFPVLDTSAGRARSFLERAPLSDAEQEAVGAGNWKRRAGHLARVP